MALVLSGLPVHSFTSWAFPPRKAGPRRRFLAVDEHSPIRSYSMKALPSGGASADALEVYGDRPAAVANDLTKLYEQVDRGSLSTLANEFTGRPLKGEYIGNRR